MEVGKKYQLIDIQQHQDCQGCDRCTVLTLMEKGFLPQEEVSMHQRLGDNILLSIGSSRFAVKEDHLECCTFELIGDI